MKPEIIFTIVFVVFISLILMLKVYLENWEGTVFERKKEKVPEKRGNKTFWTDVDFAILKLTNGKTKKIRAMPDWQAGTHLIKRRGEFQVKILNG